MGFIKVLLMLIIIPIFGYGVSAWILSDVNKGLTEQGIEYSTTALCANDMSTVNSSVHEFCGEMKPLFLMQDASLVSGGVALLLLISFLIASGVAGTSRDKITTIFPPLVFVSLLFLSIIVLVQGAILTYGAYLAESHAIERVHFILIAGIGIAALVGGFGLIKSAFQLASKQKHGVIGTTLNRESHSKIFSFVENIAAKLGSRMPDNIVVGLEPNFYVTSANVNVHGDDKTLSGETLFLSLPLSRIFTHDELKAVIGHELGHFRGNDTYYSLKFSPVYAGLTHGLQAMQSKTSQNQLATLPASIFLSYMMDVFHRNVSEISRTREFEADRAATEVAPAQSLATALLKISLYANAWGNLENSVALRLSKNKQTYNLSQLFSSVVKYDVNKEKIPEVISEIGEQNISHPTDSHPPTVMRIKELGLAIDEIDHALLLLQSDNSIDLINNHIQLEEELTILQLKYYVSLGVQISEEQDVNNSATLIAAFGAHMVLADGKVEPEEIDSAESIGLSLVSEFDIIEFREYCHYPDNLPTIDDLLNASKEIDADAKTLIYDYLTKIAQSDNDMSTEESALLDKVKSTFSL